MQNPSALTRMILLSALIGLLALAGCQTPLDAAQNSGCRSGGFALDGDFDGARLGDCVVAASAGFVLNNAPEDRPINQSPWYAFRVTGGEGTLTVRINYALHRHRYWPKYSIDGENWQRLPEQQVQVADGGAALLLTLDKRQPTLWVAGQELLTENWYQRWYTQLLSVPGVSRERIGTSVGGRPLVMLQTNPSAARTLLLVGRQHPPEVTGALAMYHFVSRLMQGQRCGPADPGSQLCRFYRDTNLVMVPLMNPDGVALGHWRHGLGHLDLNRDWGPFTQPETRALKHLIDRLADADKAPVLFLDFHSTFRDLFYTQSGEEERAHRAFGSRWLALARDRGVPPIEQQPRHNRGLPTSKNYMFSRFGIPAITYELGDETPRQDIRRSAYGMADALVHLFADASPGVARAGVSAKQKREAQVLP